MTIRAWRYNVPSGKIDDFWSMSGLNGAIERLLSFINLLGYLWTNKIEMNRKKCNYFINVEKLYFYFTIATKQVQKFLG